jgi:hypothetical protein
MPVHFHTFFIMMTVEGYDPEPTNRGGGSGLAELGRSRGGQQQARPEALDRRLR